MPIITETIDDQLGHPLNYKYGEYNKITLASKMLKESVNVGEAIVNVLSNTGIAGFKFNIPKREQIKFQSEITDHYTDANNPIEDHIAHKPIRVTLTGLHGEYFYSVHQLEDAISKIIPTLSLVKQFLPKLPDNAKQSLLKKYQALSGKDQENILNQIQIDSAPNQLNNVDLFKLFQDIYKIGSSQTRAYLFLKALWKSKAIFSVETTFERFDNMVVEDLSPLRDDNADNAEFTIVFKQINFTKTITTKVEGAVGRLSSMLQGPVQKGVDKGKEVPTI